MTVAAPTTADLRIPPGHYGLIGVIRSEWTKLRSLRSTVWTLGITLIAILGFAALVTAATASHWRSAGIATRATFDPTATSLALSIFLGQIAIGVLGVLAISAEYSSGTIRSTLAAVPHRTMVLVGKVIVFGCVALVVSEISTFCAFEIGQQLLRGSTPYATLGQPGVLRAVVGTGLVLTVLGLLALGLATIIRHTAGSIFAFVGLVLVLTFVSGAFPTSVQNAVERYLPLIIAEHMTVTNPLHTGHLTNAPLFSQWAGFGVLCGYAVLALGVGAWLMNRRDA